MKFKTQDEHDFGHSSYMVNKVSSPVDIHAGSEYMRN